MEVQEGRPVRTTLYDQLSLELPPSSGSKLTTSSSSPCLGDLLKFRHEEEDPQHLQQQQQPARGRRSARSVSLGTFLACEKRELPLRSIATVVASTAAVPDGTGGGRTLLDIIRDDDDQESRGSGGGSVFQDALVGCANNRHRISWRRAFKERLRIRRSGNPVDGGVSEEGTLLASPTAPSLPGIPVQDDRPVRAGAGDAAQPTQPTGPSAPVGASSDLATGDGTAGDQAQQRTGSSCGPPAPAAGTAEEGQQQQVQQPAVRVSLMTLLDQTDTFRPGGAGFAVPAPLEEDQEQEQEQDQERGKKKKRYNAGKCCVCMVRHRGAAFIPCGHTFCRLCCRELWVSRGSCPLCNGLILEVLDIF